MGMLGYAYKPQDKEAARALVSCVTNPCPFAAKIASALSSGINCQPNKPSKPKQVAKTGHTWNQTARSKTTKTKRKHHALHIQPTPPTSPLTPHPEPLECPPTAPGSLRARHRRMRRGFQRPPQAPREEPEVRQGAQQQSHHRDLAMSSGGGWMAWGNLGESWVVIGG